MISLNEASGIPRSPDNKTVDKHTSPPIIADPSFLKNKNAIRYLDEIVRILEAGFLVAFSDDSILVKEDNEEGRFIEFSNCSTEVKLIKFTLSTLPESFDELYISK